jgi:signal transduction histidine kinase
MKPRIATYLPVCVVFFLSIKFAIGQPTVVEQLRNQINTASSDTARLKALLRLCAQWSAINPDTVNKYNSEARALAFLQNDENAIWLTDYYHTVYQFKKNGPDSAYHRAVEVEKAYTKKHGYDSMYVNLYRLKMNILLKKMKVEEITATSFQLLQQAVDAKDAKGQIAANMGLGSANLKMEKTAEALDWYKKALALCTNPILQREFNVLYSNIGIAYYVMWLNEEDDHLKDSATHYTNLGVQYANETDNPTLIADALMLHSSMLAEAGDLKQAETALQRALALRKQIGDTYYSLTDMLGLVMFYQNNNEHQKAIDVAQEGLKLAAAYGLPWSTVYALYEKLGQSYESTGDYKKYSNVLKELIVMNDSAYRANSLHAMAEVETKYGLKDKETTIIKQQLAIANREKLAAGSLCFLLILGGLGYWGFSRYKRKKMLQMRQEKLRSQKESEKAVKEAEENQRKRIAAELHDNIGAQISYITSNIDWIVDSTNPLGKEEQTERLKSIHQTSVDVMRNLRETLWTLNKEEITLDEFSDKLKSYIQTILRLKPSMQFSSSEQLHGETTLGPLEALNMFRIMQEAANNVLKHSGASNLHLSVEESENGEFEISLKDNGSGFNLHEFYDGHYGLKNMRYRAKEVGININIESKTGEGSKITVARQVYSNM